MGRVVAAIGLNSIGLLRPFAESLTTLQVECVEVPWGCGADEAKLEQILKADTDKKIKAVAVVHNETTTGVTSDIKQVREVPPFPSMSRIVLLQDFKFSGSPMKTSSSKLLNVMASQAAQLYGRFFEHHVSLILGGPK